MDPVTRIENYLARITGGDGRKLSPVTRVEQYLAKIAGDDVKTPDRPITRKEIYLANIAGESWNAPPPVTRVEKYLAAMIGIGEKPESPITRVEQYLDNWQGGSGEEKTVSGETPVNIFDAIGGKLKSLIQYGKTVQDGTPTPDAPVWPVINNGTVRMVRPSGLPVRYQMVEWLTVTSPSKRITITGFKTKSTQEFECKWYRSAKINCYLYASDASSSLTTNTTAYLATTNGTWRFDGRAAGFSAPVETICTSIQNKDGVWINGSKVGSYGDAGDFVSTNDLYLLNGSGSADVRFYYLKVRENGNLVLDLVPVRDNVDGVYGVYDKVSGEFYTNAEATFSAGADVEDTPSLIVDGTPEVLTVGGRNLANPALVDGEGWYIASGKIANSAAANRTIVFPCKPNTTYSWWHCDGVGGMRAFESNAATPTVGDTAAWAVGSPAYRAANVVTTYTTSATAKYLIIDYSRRDSSSTRTHDEQLADFMLVEGAVSEALPYEPYNAQTATVPDLYAVGDYKDEAEIISGGVTRKVGVKVLDGTENWTLNGTMRYVLTIPDMATLSGRTEGLCTHFAYAGSSANEWTYFLTSARRMFVHTDFEAVANWKAYLAAQYAAGTPVIVWYPLAEPTTDQTTPQSLRLESGANTIDAVTEVGAVEIDAKYKSK